MIGQVLDLFKKEDDNDPNKNSRDDVNFGKKKFVKMPNATLGALAGLAYNPVSMLVKNIGNPEAYPYKILPIPRSKEKLKGMAKLLGYGLVGENFNRLPASLALMAGGAAIGYGLDKYKQKSIQYEKDRFSDICSWISDRLATKGIHLSKDSKEVEEIADVMRLSYPKIYYNSENKKELIKALATEIYANQNGRIEDKKE